MNLVVNGEKLEFAELSTAFNLVDKLGYRDQRIALEVNEKIIPKSSYKEYRLSEGDKVEIIKAVGGG
ncbi:MAG: sulfur carrier protein ThiS [Gammaproteobacteria bacterium]|nr:sulfur carrier protein ThiS [Gammaproteobacteria bacterium]|tara:strand:+ start:136 stop:336 length:201 start_codon:yes stop_codon:yes gene_type:complete